MVKRTIVFITLTVLIGCHPTQVNRTESSLVFDEERSSNADTINSFVDTSSSEVHIYKQKVTCVSYSSGSNAGFRLFFSADTAFAYKCGYYIPEQVKKLSDSAKIKLMEELLRYEGDTSICALPIMCYDMRRSQTCNLPSREYSIQVEALFLINLIYFDEPYFYSSFPVLVNRKTDQQEAIRGNGINLAYKLYKEWLEKVKRLGWAKAQETKVYPFDAYSNVRWL